MTSIQERVPNQSKSEKLINKGCTSPHLPSPKYGKQPSPRGPSNHLSHFFFTSSCRERCDVLTFCSNYNCTFIPFRPLKFECHSRHVLNMSHCVSPTSLWLPPVFSSCRFCPAGIVYFSHSWRGLNSELPGRCRLSAHSPQHTGKSGEFLPLWSSSFFKRSHSIL